MSAPTPDSQELDRTYSKAATCYLCDSENPDADEEACDACDAAFWSNPAAIWIPDEEAP